MNIIIRKAEKNDLRSVLSLYSQPDMDNGEVLDIIEAERIFDKMEQYPDYSVYVAELDGSIVGTFALAIMDNLAHMGMPSGLIEDVVVSEAFQGKGIGKCMMNRAIGICRNKGCYKVSLLSSLKREKAHGFYEGIGFIRHGYSFYTDLLEN